MNRILALDQAKHTGYAVFELKDTNEYELIDYGVLDSKFENYELVALDISKKVQSLINKYNPKVLLLEDVQNQSNPSSFKKLSMLLGVLLKTSHLNNIPYEIYSCNTWRKILRNNLPYHGKRIQRTEWKKASKQFALDTYGIKVNNDIADAICIGLYYLNFEIGDD